jgi:uncharacterized phage protein (TIGR01671 family)
MNSRHLFRGKSTAFSDWVIGGYCKRTYLKRTRTHVGDYIVIIDKSEQGYKHTGYIHVNPDTVGQCTGTPDKNKTLIYEGDVVKFVHPSPDVQSGIGVVMWNQDEMAWEFRVPGAYSWYHGYAGELYEVIGNIHDNPELLEKVGDIK